MMIKYLYHNYKGEELKMLLSKESIKKELLDKDGGIVINPFDLNKLNPNSYNVTLDDVLYVYEDHVLDMKKNHKLKRLNIPKEGLLLVPGVVYIGKTVEYTETTKYIPMLEGRSSIGRLGISIHTTAGFGDIGFKGYWTLEISVTQPVKIYPGVEIGQLYYQTIDNTDGDKYNGKYQNNKGAEGSKIYTEMNCNEESE